MDAVSELMEQGEHRLAVNRRRWRRDQGALEAPLCVRTTAGYCHHGFFGECGVIFQWARAAGSSPGGLGLEELPVGCLGCNLKLPFSEFVYMRLHTRASAGNVRLNPTSGANDRNVPKSPLKNICGSITIKTFCL